MTTTSVPGSRPRSPWVRADALANLAEVVGGAALGGEVRSLLVGCPLPLAGEGLAGVPALRDAYAAQERAVVAIAARLDEVAGGYEPGRAPLRIARGQIPCLPGERMPLGSSASLIVSVKRR
jgi:hypothetical protein